MAKIRTAKQVAASARRAEVLSERQKAFVRGYLVDMNATAAYRRAGYKPHKDAVAASAASELLRVPKVAKALEEAFTKLAQRSAATVERLEQELERLALSDLRKLFAPDGTLKPVSEWDGDTAAAVASVEFAEKLTERGGRPLITSTKKVICHSKLEAIIELLKRRDMAKNSPPGSSPHAPSHVNLGVCERIRQLESAFLDAASCTLPSPVSDDDSEKPEEPVAVSHIGE